MSGTYVMRAGLIACRLGPALFNPDLKARYTALRTAGKPAEVGIVAVICKLLETANALVKADRRRVDKTTCA